MTKFYGRLETYRSVSTYGGIFCKPCHDFLKISKFLLSNMGEVLRKFSKNQVMVYGFVSFQSSISTYRSVTFQLSVKSFTDP